MSNRDSRVTLTTSLTTFLDSNKDSTFGLCPILFTLPGVLNKQIKREVKRSRKTRDSAPEHDDTWIECIHWIEREPNAMMEIDLY